MAGAAAPDDDDDEEEFIEVEELIGYGAALLLIDRGLLHDPTDAERGDRSMREYAAEMLGENSPVWKQAQRDFAVMKPAKIGAMIRRVLGCYDA
jgi:hypothetical protein